MDSLTEAVMGVTASLTEIAHMVARIDERLESFEEILREQLEQRKP